MDVVHTPLMGQSQLRKPTTPSLSSHITPAEVIKLEVAWLGYSGGLQRTETCMWPTEDGFLGYSVHYRLKNWNSCPSSVFFGWEDYDRSQGRPT